ncbi:hypothetical protein V6N13_019711 [Hibiscus sabdariffa]
MRVLLWNVRGLGSSVKRMVIRKVLQQQCVEMASVQIDLWRRLDEAISELVVPVCCGGDFNVVLSLEERRHCVGDKRRMDGFVSFVEEVVSPEWVEKFCGLEQFILQRGISDHAPVRLTSGVVDWGPKPFRFLNYWLEKMRHVKLMKTEWRRIGEVSDATLSILDKLRLLKAFLKVWNQKLFGSVDLQIEATTDLLNDLEERDECMDDSTVLVDSMRELQGNLWRLLKYRACIWRQKLQVLWL